MARPHPPLREDGAVSLFRIEFYRSPPAHDVHQLKDQPRHPSGIIEQLRRDVGRDQPELFEPVEIRRADVRPLSSQLVGQVVVSCHGSAVTSHR